MSVCYTDRSRDPSHLLQGLDRHRLEAALFDRHTPGVHKSRQGKGIEPWREFLVGTGWTDEDCSVYLLDRRYRNIPNAVAAQLLAAYALDLVSAGRNAPLHLQALQDAFIGVGRDVDCFRHPLVSAARKPRTRQEGREAGREALRKQREAISEEMLWWGIHEFLPPHLDLQKASAGQADLAMAMLAGLITYHWPNIRLSNQACAVSHTQASAYTREWKRVCTAAGLSFDETVARDRFLKAHSFRMSDVRIGTVLRDGTEQWVDPLTWRDGEARTYPVPMMVTLAVMSAKRNQNGNRPQLQTAVAATCAAEEVICRALGQVILAGNHESLDDLLLSRLRESTTRGTQPSNRRRNLPTAAIGTVAKKVAVGCGVNPDQITGNSFKIGGASSKVMLALAHAKKQAQAAMDHKNLASSNHYMRFDNSGGFGSAAPWTGPEQHALPTNAIRRSAAMFREKIPNATDTRRVRFAV